MTHAPSIRLLHIDAFTHEPFRGNPAAVCLLGQRSPSATWMQSLAAEMNLSETAFVRGIGPDFDLRWFTPKVEVPLCGHATLASAHALWTTGIIAPDCPIRFHTASGILTCIREKDWITLNFPAQPPHPAPLPNGLLAALGIQSNHVKTTARNAMAWLIELSDEPAVRAVQPDFVHLAAITELDALITSRASQQTPADFVSRLFAPAQGIPEDPVTGAAHCALGPYWAGLLEKKELVGYQASSRGGFVRVRLQEDRVALSGQAVTILSSSLAIGVS